MALVAGEGGVGKSMFLMACTTAVSTGGPWPSQGGIAPKGTVIMVSAEAIPIRPSALGSRPWARTSRG